MSIKLLPASVNPVDPSEASDGSTSLVPLTQRAIATQASQISLVTPADAFTWSPTTRRRRANRIYGTPVDDSQSDQTGRSTGQYVSGWAGISPVERTAIAHYLFYAASPASWRGWLIDLYA
jgi:hypothetical protein